MYDIIQLCQAWNKCLLKSNFKTNVISRENQNLWSSAPSCRKPHTVFIKADRVKIDSSTEKQPITLIRESKPAANTNIHQTLAMFEPLPLSPENRPSSMMTPDDYSIFLHGSLHRIWKYLRVSRGHLFRLGNKNA